MKKPDLNSLTLRERIAQTLLVRQSDLLMRADRNYAELRRPEEAREIVAANGFGGIWTHGNIDVNGMDTRYNDYFAFTTKNYVPWLMETIADLKIPPFCGNDPEGRRSFLDLSVSMKGSIIGAADSPELAYELGRCTALEHKAAGYNWLWGPMVDLVNRFTTSVTRPMANRSEKLIEISAAYIKGIQSAGVAATAKHFPGNDGRDTRDAHLTVPKNRCSVEEWKKGQGAVFQAMIDAGVMTIMSNARMFPAMDATEVGGRCLSAGLSKHILIHVLKGKMGFEGVVITDDVNMGGYTSYYPREELYARLLAAGNDVLLGVGIDALELVEKGLEKGIVTEERINDACRRVLDLKEKLGMFKDGYEPTPCSIEEILPQTEAVSRKIARDGITLLWNRGNLLPMKVKPSHVTIFLFTHKESVMDNLQTMKRAFEQRGAEVSLRRRPQSFAEVEDAARNSDLIVYAGYIDHFAPKGAPSFYDEEHWAFRYAFTAGKEKSVGISLGYPFIHYNYMEEAGAFVNLYSLNDMVQEAFVTAVYGESAFKGVSPINLEIE